MIYHGMQLPHHYQHYNLYQTFGQYTYALFIDSLSVLLKEVPTTSKDKCTSDNSYWLEKFEIPSKVSMTTTYLIDISNLLDTFWALVQNTGSLICMSLNWSSFYFDMPLSPTHVVLYSAIEPPVSNHPKMSSQGGRLQELRPYWVKISRSVAYGSCRGLDHVLNVLFLRKVNFKKKSGTSSEISNF